MAEKIAKKGLMDQLGVSAKTQSLISGAMNKISSLVVIFEGIVKPIIELLEELGGFREFVTMISQTLRPITVMFQEFQFYVGNALMQRFKRLAATLQPFLHILANLLRFFATLLVPSLEHLMILFSVFEFMIEKLLRIRKSEGLGTGPHGTATPMGEYTPSWYRAGVYSSPSSSISSSIRLNQTPGIGSIANDEYYLTSQGIISPAYNGTPRPHWQFSRLS